MSNYYGICDTCGREGFMWYEGAAVQHTCDACLCIHRERLRFSDEQEPSVARDIVEEIRRIAMVRP